MNYLNIHDKLIEYCRDCSPEQRYYNRTGEHVTTTLYTEKHHIVPTKAGGDNSETNIVTVLPEEHLFLHMLRYKIFNSRVDFLAVRVMINGFLNKDFGDLCNIEKIRISKKTRKMYQYMRNHIQQFRKEHGWQTQDGRNRISNARLGTMPVKDAITNEMIGSVATTHPNVISGEWVHHSTGRKFPNTATDHNGSKNPNYKPFTNEIDNMIQNSIIETNTLYGKVTANKFFEIINSKLYNTSYKKISVTYIHDNYGDFGGLCALVERNTNISLNLSGQVRHKSKGYNNAKN